MLFLRDVTSRFAAFLWALLGATLAAACVRPPDVIDRPDPPDDPVRFVLAGQFGIRPLGRFPPGIGLQFGGISGLAATAGGAELLGISDDRTGLRVYRFRISGEGQGFRVETIDQIPLDSVSSGLGQIDPEAIAILPNANLLITSDGVGNTEPRVPPALVEYTRHGAFVRALPVRDRFVPNLTGPLEKGVRANVGFESLTLVPGGQRFYTAVESSLVQDGELTTFERGAPARILEYVREGDSYAPGREFVYMVEPIHRPSFQPGRFDNGLVELLALGGEELLALERSFVEEAGNTGRDMNRIRLFRISLAGATDVSSIDSLKDMTGVAAVSKKLVLDLSDVAGLSPDLAPGLDNFEGLAFGPPLPDGRPTLIIVSDDNFNETQRTWFLQFAIGES